MPAGAPSFCSCRLLCGLLGRYNRYEGSALTRQESDAAIGGGKEGVVFAHAHVHARVHFRAALTNDDVAGEHLLIAELLDAQTTACRVAAVARRTACFFVSHGLLPCSSLDAAAYSAVAGAASCAAALVVFPAAAPGAWP